MSSNGRNRPFGASGASVDAAGNPLPGLTINTYNVVANDPQRTRPRQGRSTASVAKLPLPNNFTGGDGLNTSYYTWTAPVTEAQQDNTIRVDHRLTDKHYLFARGAWGHQNSVCDAANSGTAFFPETGCNVNTERGPKNIAASWRYLISPKIVNEFIFGHSDFTFNFISPQAQPGQIFFQGGDGGGTVSNSLGAGDAPVLVENLSYAIGNLRTIRTRQFVDNLSFIHGAHTFKTGANLRFVQHADIRGSVGGANANTTVNFNPAINTVNTAAFNIPSDLNVQFDRPEFERNINFLLGRVGQISPRLPLRRRALRRGPAARQGHVRRDGVLYSGHLEGAAQSDGRSRTPLGAPRRAERAEQPDRQPQPGARLWRRADALGEVGAGQAVLQARLEQPRTLRRRRVGPLR